MPHRSGNTAMATACDLQSLKQFNEEILFKKKFNTFKKKSK